MVHDLLLSKSKSHTYLLRPKHAVSDPVLPFQLLDLRLVLVPAFPNASRASENQKGS